MSGRPVSTSSYHRSVASDGHQRYSSWDNGAMMTPLVVQGYGASAHSSHESKSEKSYPHRSTTSHLSRMRSIINDQSHINIKDLLKQASQDLSSQRSARYNNVTGSFLQHQDTAQISSIRSALSIKGMETERAPATERMSVTRIIRAEIPRVDMEEPTTHRYYRHIKESSTSQRYALYDDKKDHEGHDTQIHESSTLNQGHVKADLPYQSLKNGKVFPSRKADRQNAFQRPSTSETSYNSTLDSSKNSPSACANAVRPSVGLYRNLARKTAWDSPRSDMSQTTKADTGSPENQPSSVVHRPANVPSPRSDLSVSSDDEGFLSNTEEEQAQGFAKKSPREADEDVLINGNNYDDKTSQLLKYYLQHENTTDDSVSPEHLFDNVKQESFRTEHSLDNIKLKSDTQPEGTEQEAVAVSETQTLQKSIIIEPTRFHIDNMPGNHVRGRSPKRTNIVLHRRVHHSPWRTYNSPVPSEAGSLTDTRSSYIEITNPLNLQDRNRRRPAIRQGSYANYYDNQIKGRSLRVSVSNPDLTSMKVVGTSMRSSTAFNNFTGLRSKKFPHTSYSAMT